MRLKEGKGTNANTFIHLESRVKGGEEKRGALMRGKGASSIEGALVHEGCSSFVRGHSWRRGTSGLEERRTLCEGHTKRKGRKC
jgi:hypothetical protein